MNIIIEDKIIFEYEINDQNELISYKKTRRESDHDEIILLTLAEKKINFRTVSVDGKTNGWAYSLSSGIKFSALTLISSNRTMYNLKAQQHCIRLNSRDPLDLSSFEFTNILLKNSPIVKVTLPKTVTELNVGNDYQINYRELTNLSYLRLYDFKKSNKNYFLDLSELISLGNVDLNNSDVNVKLPPKIKSVDLLEARLSIVNEVEIQEITAVTSVLHLQSDLPKNNCLNHCHVFIKGVLAKKVLENEIFYSGIKADFNLRPMLLHKPYEMLYFSQAKEKDEGAFGNYVFEKYDLLNSDDFLLISHYNKIVTGEMGHRFIMSLSCRNLDLENPLVQRLNL